MLQGWESQARNWASFARTPGVDRAHERVNLPAVLDLLPLPGDRTLDLACGEGRLTRLLGSLGHRVVGVDAAPGMVGLAAGHQEARPVLLADAGGLPFRDESFDLVLAYMCLHDIDEMPRAVAEVGRVLQPSGRVVIAIPHPVSTAGEFQAKDPEAPFVISGSYLDPTPTTFVAERESFRLTFYSEHRPLEAYARALEEAGMVIETLREIRTPDDAVADAPSMRRFQRIPLFLHLLARKRP